MHVDWLTRSLVFAVRPKVSKTQDLDRGARVVVTGVEWLVIDPAGPAALPEYDPGLVNGYDIDSRPGVARDGLPTVPDGAFAHHFFVVERHSFIHFCARDATFEWTEDAPRAFPGDGARFFNSG